MHVSEGEKIRSKLDGVVYTIKRIGPKSLVLESETGRNQSWTKSGALDLFFEKVPNPGEEEDDLRSTPPSSR
jgi:hypothetical protein